MLGFSPLTPFQQFGVVTAITDRVRADCSGAGSAAAMIVVGAYQNLRLRHTVKGGVILGHGVSKFRGNVRLSVQQKCHSVKP